MGMGSSKTMAQAESAAARCGTASIGAPVNEPAAVPKNVPSFARRLNETDFDPLLGILWVLLVATAIWIVNLP